MPCAPSFRNNDALVPVLYALSFLLIIAGNALFLAGMDADDEGLSRTGAILLLCGVAGTFVSSLIHIPVSSDNNASPSSEPEISRAEFNLDHPAALLQVATCALLLAANAAFVSVVWGGLGLQTLRVLFLVGSATMLASTLLHLLSEVHRTVDVANVVQSLRGESVEAMTLDDTAVTRPTVEQVRETVVRCVSRWDRTKPMPSINRLWGSCHCCCCCCCCSPTAVRTRGYYLRYCFDLLNAASPSVASGLLANSLASALFLIAAIYLCVGSDKIAVPIFIASFGLFLLGITMILTVGAEKVAAHRRGGLIHLENDVLRALERR
jgi:hypothetical protein